MYAKSLYLTLVISVIHNLNGLLVLSNISQAQIWSQYSTVPYSIAINSSTISYLLKLQHLEEKSDRGMLTV